MRRRFYDSLPPDIQLLVRKAFVQLALRNEYGPAAELRELDERLKSLPEDEYEARYQLGSRILVSRHSVGYFLKLMGRETDRTLVPELEAEFGVALDAVRIAQEIMNLTYICWRMNAEIQSAKPFPSAPHDLEWYVEQLRELVQSADILRTYVLPATHATLLENVWSIAYAKSLVKSISSKEVLHYEGDGVYAGVLGCYRDWIVEEDGRIYEFLIPLADSFPFFVNNKSPRFAVCMLGELLYLPETSNEPATTHGLMQWRQEKYRDVGIAQ